jgi:hypothetical protein
MRFFLFELDNPTAMHNLVSKNLSVEMTGGGRAEVRAPTVCVQVLLLGDLQ